jgi:gas vesicle protein
MSSLDKDTKKFLAGALLGGVLGICLSSMHSASKKGSKHNKTLDALGKAVIHMGEILKSKETADSPIIHNFGKSIHEHEETITDVLEIVSSGLNLWQKFRKGL